jgi:hypothetical protein
VQRQDTPPCPPQWCPAPPGPPAPPKKNGRPACGCKDSRVLPGRDQLALRHHHPRARSPPTRRRSAHIAARAAPSAAVATRLLERKKKLRVTTVISARPPITPSVQRSVPGPRSPGWTSALHALRCCSPWGTARRLMPLAPRLAARAFSQQQAQRHGRRDGDHDVELERQGKRRHRRGTGHPSREPAAWLMMPASRQRRSVPGCRQSPAPSAVGTTLRQRDADQAGQLPARPVERAAPRQVGELGLPLRASSVGCAVPAERTARSSGPPSRSPAPAAPSAAGASHRPRKWALNTTKRRFTQKLVARMTQTGALAAISGMAASCELPANTSKRHGQRPRARAHARLTMATPVINPHAARPGATDRHLAHARA